MDLSKLKLFAMATKRMDWLSKRQIVLSQNVANADTPSYRPEDLKPLNFRDIMREQHVQQGLEKTSSMHIDASRQPEKYREDKMRHTYETTPTGNAVVLEEQLGKISETQADHRLASNLYTKQLQMIQMALGKPIR